MITPIYKKPSNLTINKPFKAYYIQSRIYETFPHRMSVDPRRSSSRNERDPSTVVPHGQPDHTTAQANIITAATPQSATTAGLLDLAAAPWNAIGDVVSGVTVGDGEEGTGVKLDAVTGITGIVVGTVGYGVTGVGVTGVGVTGVGVTGVGVTGVGVGVGEGVDVVSTGVVYVVS